MTADREKLGLSRIKTFYAIAFPVVKETRMKIIFAKF